LLWKENQVNRLSCDNKDRETHFFFEIASISKGEGRRIRSPVDSEM